jgi:small subunit ribosomal protein S9
MADAGKGGKRANAEEAGDAEREQAAGQAEASSEQPADATEGAKPEKARSGRARAAREAAGTEAASEDAAAPREEPQGAGEQDPAGDAAAAPEAVAPEPAASAEQSEPPAAAQPAAEADSADAAAPAPSQEAAEQPGEEEQAAPAAAKPAVPGAHLEVDIVPEGADPLGREEEQYQDPYALEEEAPAAEAGGEEEQEGAEEVLAEPIATAAIDLAAGARYRATGKRKTAIARVTLRPGSGTYEINGRTLEQHFPRTTLQRNIRQPLETVGYHERMDVVARLEGGGISAQAGALRHGVSRALLEADPNLRGELKRRGFLTRDSRAKERKKAGLKKARKRPQFSKR